MDPAGLRLRLEGIDVRRELSGAAVALIIVSVMFVAPSGSLEAEGYVPRTGPPSVSMFPQVISPGEAAILVVDYGIPGRYRVINPDGRVVDGGRLLVNPQGAYRALVAVPLDWPLGTYRVESHWEAGGSVTAEFLVVDGEYPATVVNMTDQSERLVSEPDPRKTEQSERLLDILNRVDESAWRMTEPFQLPLADIDRISSSFGQTRRYHYPSGRETRGFHLGIDYPKPEGTPVYASGEGLVVMAEERILTGNTVIIEHFPGTYSLYYHMSSLATRVGQEVAAGDLIGRVGMMGLATGPHLHWELRVNSHAVNPATLRNPDFVAKLLGE